jgi:hypothetical protein
VEDLMVRVEVSLDPGEMAIACCVGAGRQRHALRKGYENKHGFHGVGWSEHIEGAAGEMAVAKYFGVYWGGAYNAWKGPDIGSHIQVRTRGGPYHELIVRHDDADEDAFVLVTGRAPHFTIHGWIYGRDAKSPSWLQTHGNRPAAYFISPDYLLPISKLKP